MDDLLQKRIGVKIECHYGVDEMKIDIEGDENNFYAQLDEISINPKIVNFHNIEIKKNGLKMDFKAPIICKTRNVESASSMMIGVKFEGKDKKSFIEKIEETARNFGPEWERSVRERKEEILKRNGTKK